MFQVYMSSLSQWVDPTHLWDLSSVREMTYTPETLYNFSLFWGLGLYSPHGLYICRINLKRKRNNYPSSSHCNVLIKLAQVFLENL